MKNKKLPSNSSNIHFIFNRDICNLLPNILYVSLSNLFTNKIESSINKKIYNKFRKILEPHKIYNSKYYYTSPPINIFNKLLVINLNETRALNIKDSIFKRECFICGNGLILITRNLPTSLNLNQHAYCVLCGQQYLIKNINEYDYLS